MPWSSRALSVWALLAGAGCGGVGAVATPAPEGAPASAAARGSASATPSHVAVTREDAATLDQRREPMAPALTADEATVLAQLEETDRIARERRAEERRGRAGGSPPSGNWQIGTSGGISSRDGEFHESRRAASAPRGRVTLAASGDVPEGATLFAARRESRARRCYLRARKLDASLSGRLSVTVIRHDDGVTSEGAAALVSGGPFTRELESCLVDALTAPAGEAPKRAATFKVSVRFDPDAD